MLDTKSYTQKFIKALDHTITEIAQLRTGKASSQMLDNVTVEAYGSRMKINELATISIPDNNLLVITPWDKSLLGPIEKAIISSQLNLAPVVDGQIVRVPVPPLTQERRQEMVKILQQKLESGRVMMRNIRAELKKEIESQKGMAGVSEDNIETDLEELQEITNDYISKVDNLGKAKEQELLSL